MAVAPVALVRGAIGPATATTWLTAIDAHPAWNERGARSDAAFNVHSSSLRLAALPSLDAAAIAAELLRGELGAFCTAHLGAVLAARVRGE